MIFYVIPKRKDSMIWVVLMNTEMLINPANFKASKECMISFLKWEDRVAEDTLDSLSNKAGKVSRAWEIWEIFFRCLVVHKWVVSFQEVLEVREGVLVKTLISDSVNKYY